MHNFILQKAVQGALDIVLNPSKWAVVLVKAGRSQAWTKERRHQPLNVVFTGHFVWGGEVIW